MDSPLSARYAISSLVAVRLGSSDDAAALDRDVRPELRGHDLAHLQRHSAAVRVCRQGETSPAFTIATEALPDPVAGRAEAIRATVRERYGTTREEVEARLAHRQQTPARLHRRVREASGSPPAAISSPSSPPISPPVSPPTKTGGPPVPAGGQPKAESGARTAIRQGEHERK